MNSTSSEESSRDNNYLTMASTMDNFLSCSRKYLFIASDSGEPLPRCFALFAIIFSAFNSIHYATWCFLPQTDFTDVILGNHFGQYGGREVLWALLSLQAASMACLVICISLYCYIKHPQKMMKNATPLNHFISEKWNEKLYYRILMFGLKFSACFAFCSAVAVDVFTFFRDSRFYKDFWPLVLSACWSYCLAGTGSMGVEILGTVAIQIDITCRKLRLEFYDVGTQLSREISRKQLRPRECLKVIKNFKILCKDLTVYDSHWKRLLFTIVIGSSIFLAFCLNLFGFTSLPKFLMICGQLVTFTFVAIFSFCLLAPSSVCTAARKNHFKFCSLMTKTQNSSFYLRVKLLYTIKSFSKQITFTLWDTNSIDYYDYLNVSRAIFVKYFE